jgi:predicted CopG family antitoxin
MSMAKRVFATVSDQLEKRLKERAEKEGRSVSDLIAYLLEREMENWNTQSAES